jgi:hypothetical protein
MSILGGLFGAAQNVANTAQGNYLNTAQGNYLNTAQNTGLLGQLNQVQGIGTAYQNQLAQNAFTQTIGAAQAAQRSPERLAMDIDESQLNSEVFSTPLSTLENLWMTKYEDKWVDLEAIADDPFFGLVYKRLFQKGLVEVHYLTNKSKYVCRVPEH